MCKSNSGFSAVLNNSFSVEPRQICRFDYLEAVAVWLLWFNEQKPLLVRYCLAPTVSTYKMKNLLLIISLFLFTASKGCNKTLLEKIEKGKILTIEVKPIGDAYSNPAEEHTLKIFKFDTKFNITLNQNNIIFKKRISKEQLIRVC